MSGKEELRRVLTERLGYVWASAVDSHAGLGPGGPAISALFSDVYDRLLHLEKHMSSGIDDLNAVATKLERAKDRNKALEALLRHSLAALRVVTHEASLQGSRQFWGRLNDNCELLTKEASALFDSAWVARNVPSRPGTLRTTEPPIKLNLGAPLNLIDGAFYSVTDGVRFFRGVVRQSLQGIGWRLYGNTDGTHDFRLDGCAEYSLSSLRSQPWDFLESAPPKEAPKGTRRVFVASPLRPKVNRDHFVTGTLGDLQYETCWAAEFAENQVFAERCCREVIDAGHLPYAPHLLLPRFMDERTERDAAIRLANAELLLCDDLWFWGEPTEGMKAEITLARKSGLAIRRLDRKPA